VSLYIDTHCHIDGFDDPSSVLAAAAHASVVTVAVTMLPSHYQILAAQLRSTDHVRVALGFHPLAPAHNMAVELALFSRQLDGTDYVGEIGLDFSDQGRKTRREQIDVFEQILSDNRIQRKVLTVHSRNAEKETVERLAMAGVTAILHWYSGPLEPVEHALAAGFFFSVNPAMLHSPECRRLLAVLPCERVLTETDGPATRISGRPAEPRDIPAVVSELARIWSLDPGDAQRLIFETMGTLYHAATQA
jgi:TatD DNase family protein